ncbi:MAG: choline-sulfatase [Alphaproteobacteria bacterium]|nr:MAG: choline-sulfatase [Alphaproteobacteria bacterium]
MARKRPNFLFIMADQLAAPALAAYGHKVTRTPRIDSLAEHGVTFENAYCNFPICAPSRFSMLSGQLPSRIGAYDNAAEFPSSVPTLMHYLRGAGYQTCLSGKMHFVGADQLHGFEDRLTTDIYPADFGWTPDWANKALKYSWSHHMQSVMEAGTCQRSLQIDFDDDVANQAVQKIFDLARGPDERPFFLCVSFTHPHDPFTCLPEHWERYDHDQIDMPAVPALPVDKLDPHARRLHFMDSVHRYDVTEEVVRRARHAYYGMISYVDDQVGRLMSALHRAGLADDTIVIFTGDHGEMLGERGMWYKMTFYEWSARIPLIVHAPKLFGPRRVRENVSLVDLLPTLLDFATDDHMPELIDPIDGRSLVRLVHGEDESWPDMVLSEYLAEGSVDPILMLKRGSRKFVYSRTDGTMLFDLATDPHELDDLAKKPGHGEEVARLTAEVDAIWNYAELERRVIESQKRRLFVHDVLLKGRYTPWDWQPRRDATQMYVRNVGIDEDVVKGRARLPFVPERKPDFPE